MKEVLITGGSSGIGAAIARQAAQKGWGVWITYHTGKDRAQALVQEIEKSGGSAKAVKLILEDRASIDAALDKIAESHSPIEALVLNASPAPQLNSFTKTTPEQLSEQFSTQVLGNHYLIQQVWKRFFCEQKGGHVVGLLSQAAGKVPWPHMLPYIVGKRGLQALLECALAELGDSGLRASAVAPDYTETPMLMKLHPYVLEAARAKKPGGVFLKAEGVAAHVVNCLEKPPKKAELVIRSL